MRNLLKVQSLFAGIFTLHLSQNRRFNSVFPALSCRKGAYLLLTSPAAQWVAPWSSEDRYFLSFSDPQCREMQPFVETLPGNDSSAS